MCWRAWSSYSTGFVYGLVPDWISKTEYYNHKEESMAISSQHVTGFVAGLGVSALSFYLYKKNQAKVDQFLQRHGFRIAGHDRRHLDAVIV